MITHEKLCIENNNDGRWQKLMQLPVAPQLRHFLDSTV